MVNQTDNAVSSSSGRAVGQDGIKSVNPTSPLSHRARSHQKIMLRKMRDCWVNGVLEPSIYQVTAQALGPANARLRPHNLWPRLIDTPDGGQMAVKTVDLVAIFYNKTRNVVLTGATGGGKRIALLEVAKLLAIDSRLGVDNFIPIVLPLSAYDRKIPFQEWMRLEVERFYQIPFDVFDEWLSYKLILPLFDGLHHIPDPEDRSHCLKEIESRWLEPNGRGAILTLEPADVAALSHPEQVEIVTLPAISNETARRYLKLYGRDLVGLRRTLNQHNPVTDLAQYPFHLHVMCLAYTGQPHPEMILAQGDTDKDPHDNQLSATFDRFFERLSTSQAQFLYHTPSRIKHTLVWLAEKCAQRRRSDFFLEDLQPSWLDHRADLLAYTLFSRVLAGSLVGLITGLIISILFGLGEFGQASGAVDVYYLLELLKNPAAGVVIGALGGGTLSFYDFRRFRTKKPLQGSFFPVRALLFGVIFGLGFGLSQIIIALLAGDAQVSDPVWALQGFLAAALAGLLFFIMSGRQATAENDIVLFDHLSWTWRNAFRGGWRSLAIGLVAGTALMGLLPVVADGLRTAAPEWAGRFILFGQTVNETIPVNLSLGALGGLLTGFVGGFVHSGLKERWGFSQILPEQKVRRSLESGLLAGTFVGLGLTIFLGILGLIYGTTLNGLWGAVTGLLMATLAGTAGGLITFWRHGGRGFTNHMVLRTILWSSLRIPFRIVYVLDDGVELLHLYNVGAGYAFTHVALQSHLRHLLLDAKEKKGDPPQRLSSRPRRLFRRRSTPSS